MSKAARAAILKELKAGYIDFATLAGLSDAEVKKVLGFNGETFFLADVAKIGLSVPTARELIDSVRNRVGDLNTRDDEGRTALDRIHEEFGDGAWKITNPMIAGGATMSGLSLKAAGKAPEVASAEAAAAQTVKEEPVSMNFLRQQIIDECSVACIEEIMAHLNPDAKIELLESRDQGGCTILYSLAGRFLGANAARIIDALVSEGADVNAPNNAGLTPLFNAAGSDNIENIPFLLAHKADLKVISSRGETVLDYAIRRAVESGDRDQFSVKELQKHHAPTAAEVKALEVAAEPFNTSDEVLEPGEAEGVARKEGEPDGGAAAGAEGVPQAVEGEQLGLLGEPGAAVDAFAEGVNT